MTYLGRVLAALSGVAFSLLLAICTGRSAAQTPHPEPQNAPATQSAQLSQPAQQAYFLPPEKLAKAVAISRTRILLGVVTPLWSMAVIWILLASRIYARIEAWAEKLLKRRWLSGLLFFAIFFLIAALTGLPLEIYSEHVERVFGVSVESWRGWAADQGKAFALTLLVGIPILLLFHWIVRRWPRRYWLGLWLVTLPISAMGMFVEPLVEPLFNRYEPLTKTNPALAADLERVVARTGTNIPPSRMYLMKASLKSNGLNAYVSGLGATKRIVVWDTTAGRIPNDEVLFIFGHETGHYVLHHIRKEFAFTAVFLFFLYWGCAAFAAWMVRCFGPRCGIPRQTGLSVSPGLSSRTGFVVLLFAVFIASFILQPFGATLSRHYEHEADIYGQEAIHGLVPNPQQTAVASFRALGEAWLDEPNPSPFVEFWFFDHPSLQSRASFALHYDPWRNGGHGKFFKN